nr:RNA-directed DNA polymerase, eukaryota, reverse transcriptase zinc-binding domain protein [Tanacetum cinerariifolium]
MTITLNKITANIIAKILKNRLINVLGDIVSEVQSAFVARRQILDGPFILNEVLHWCSKKKQKSLIFKCCLKSSKGSILVNGSTTNEFQFYKELKQGDPLSLFLFILIMESLHLSFQRAVDVGLFKGVNLNHSLCLSHMFYTDDAIFIGKWSDGNITTLIHVLECFFHALGLKINLCKSKIMGVNVEGLYVNQAAVKLGCQEVVEKVKIRLSKWKMKTLSIGGRLTLLKSVLGSIPIFHMSIFRFPSRVLQILESIRGRFFNGHEIGSKKVSWVKWNNVLTDKKCGGLGVSSLYVLNRGLMIKWLWKFFVHKDSIWTKVITAIHGVNGNVNSSGEKAGRSCWLAIVDEVWALHKKESSGEFSVASIRRIIDEMRFLNIGDTSRWVKLWRIKRRALLIQHGCEPSIEVFLADIKVEAKAELNKKAHSAVILCLGNKVLREVTAKTIATRVWSKLETLYMTKSLANKLYLKKKLYTFYMSAGQKISEHMDEFNQIVFDLTNIEDHLKRKCPKNNRKKSSGYVNKDDQPSSSGLIYDGYEVMMLMSAEALLDWIMDLG